MKLQGKEVNFNFDWNMIADYEDKFDTNILYELQRKKVGFSFLRGLYWITLKKVNPDIEVNEVGNMLQKAITSKEHTMTTLAEPLLNALMGSGVIDINVKKKSSKN